MQLKRTSTSILGVCVALWLSGCALVNDTGRRLVSTKVDAWLQINKQALTGDVLLLPDRTGRVSFTAAQGDITRCVGGLRYTGTSTADIDLHCNDGTQASVQAVLQGETRGYGYGVTTQGTANLAFGMDEDEAQAFMGRLPVSPAAPTAMPEAPAPTP